MPLQLKASVRYTRANTLYYNKSTSVYTINENETIDNPNDLISSKYNEDL